MYIQINIIVELDAASDHAPPAIYQIHHLCLVIYILLFIHNIRIIV